MADTSRQDTLFNTLLTQDIPLMDVRSPGEFEHGAFPSAHNLPVLDDEQRAKVGTCYKQEGQEQAVALGHQLLSGQVLQQRNQEWVAFTQQHPHGYLYCARGGMRSQKVQRWLTQQGTNYPLIPGGYKALRRYLLDILDSSTKTFDFIVLGGPTGSGKTHFLHSFKDHCIDLEGLAHHRGSTFGRRLQSQPSQINFENALAIALLKAEAKGVKTIILEDESKLIGRCCLPSNFQKIIKNAPIFLLEETIENRLQTISHDYILDNLNDYQERYDKDTGFKLFAEDLLANLKRISRRLGGERYSEISSIMQKAITHYQKSNNNKAFDDVIKWLLINYYDPMYTYQLTHKPREILVRGKPDKITQWVDNHLPEIKEYRIAV